ncbi:uncharacterized protein LOC120847507 [Ixodes scapularis]|uniref:uncharacterized protein LOC120847507 n=1 Tax=Ixodes scapularis TaxID=6945 RepID=UPI001A9EB403|nr:uncharacterized protein LOC120847507 [Ixodes scapularis]
MSLSLCLTGEALTVVGRMTPEQSLDYSKVKLSLLQRFRYTTEGYREKFRESKPEEAETGKQFAARLLGYFDRWVETGEIAKTFEALKDLIVAEQFLKYCHPMLSVFLKERNCKTLENMAVTADHFLEAQGQTNLAKRNNDSLNSNKGGDRSKEDTRIPPTARGRSQCFLCNKPGHKAADCWASTKAQRLPVCWRCGKTGHKAAACNWKPQDKQDRPPQASCMLSVRPTPDETDPDDTYVLLKNGDKIPVVNAALGKAPRFLVKNMPVVRGEVGDRAATVLRDSGCNTIVVNRDLVTDDQLTGVSSPVFLLDRTVKYLPEAEMDVRTPYFTGKVLAKCMENPLYDLVLGNIEGARGIDDPDEEWEGEGSGRSKRSEESNMLISTSVRHETAGRMTQDEGERMPDDGVLDKERKYAGALRKGRSDSQRTFSELPVMTLDPIDIDHAKLKEAQRSDETLKRCFAVVGTAFVSGKSQESEFFLHNCILYRRYKDSSQKQWKQLVVPKEFRQIVLKLAHEGIMAGHQGTGKTTDRIREEFYWPGITADAKRFVKLCDICQRTIPKHLVIRAPLENMPIISTPFHRVGIDIIGPINPGSESGSRYVLTVVDFATRYPDAIPLKSIDTAEVAEGLLQIFARVGLPREIVSDRGSCFTSALMKEVSRLLSLRHLTTTPYHPMCNGLFERFNGTIKQMIKRMCQEKPRCWDRYLNPLFFAYREVPQSSLGFSPFELLYGRHVRGPMTVLKELWTNESIDPETKTTYGYMVDLRRRLEETCKTAHEELRKAQMTQKRYYDKKSGVRQLKEGDRVLILLPTDKNKLILQWKGPFPVLKRRNNVDYLIDLGRKSTVFHINMLKKYEEMEVLCAPRQALVGITIEEESEEQDIPSVCLSQLEGYNDVQMSEELTERQAGEVYQLLEEFRDVFSDCPGRTSLVQCKLRLTTDTPIQVRPYPVPLALQDAVEMEVDEMLQQGIIEKCDSAYSSPYLNSARKLNNRVLRWSLLLAEYDFHVAYIKGSENFGADFLSRL